MAKRTKRDNTVDLIPYTPSEWTTSQQACHVADSLDAALKAASALAGGWYQRPVTIDCQFDETTATGERYMMRPSEVAVLDGWEPVYTIQKAEA